MPCLTGYFTIGTWSRLVLCNRIPLNRIAARSHLGLSIDASGRTKNLQP
jgi:hypothetical protein